MDDEKPMPSIGTNIGVNNTNNEVTNRTVRAISNELVGALLNFLQQYPYKDVNGLINSLSSSPSVNVTFTNNAGSPTT